MAEAAASAPTPDAGQVGWAVMRGLTCVPLALLWRNRMYLPLGILALSLPSCGLLFGVRLPADDEILESISPIEERDTVGAYVTWRLTEPDPSDSDVVERTLAFVADHGQTHVVEERETQRSGEQIITARVFGKDGLLIAAYRGEPNQLGKPLRILKLEQLMGRLKSNPEVKKVLGGRDIESVAERAPKKIKMSKGEQLETVQVPAGSFQCTRFEMSMRVLWISYSDIWWRTKQPLPLTNLVKSVNKSSMGGLGRSAELLRYAWKGAKPTLKLPDLTPRKWTPR